MNEVIRTYKDGVFRLLFTDKSKIIELYNALSGSNYDENTEVQIVTLDEAIFGDVKNDLAFVIDGRFIVLTEHQASINPNMPLRMLIYVAKEYERLYLNKDIYSTHLIKIPTPELYVFYNGKTSQPPQKTYRLSDAFTGKCDRIFLEAEVTMINVRYDEGAELLKKCETMKEYSRFVHIMETEIASGKTRQEAIRSTINICRDEEILKIFLNKYGGDIVSLLFDALTTEECMQIRMEDGYRDGLEQGKIETAKAMLDNGLPIETILKCTGLPKEQIQALSDK